MLYRKFLWILPIASTLNFLVAIPEAQANCPGSVQPLEEVQPQVQQRWDELQRQETYPWGTTKVYERLIGDRITLVVRQPKIAGWRSAEEQGSRGAEERFVQVLSPLPLRTSASLLATTQSYLGRLLAASFDQLRGSHKQEALNLLRLGNYLHSVYASDGRLLSAVYDACTRFDMLTEKARYSWYYNSVGRWLPSNLPREALRNAGRPSWRQVRVPITEAQERSIRNLFWNRMGYTQANNGMWIGWVPEHGYFEINVPNGYNIKQLGQFWRSAPRNYRYIVLSTDGSLVFDANFD